MDSTYVGMTCSGLTAQFEIIFQNDLKPAARHCEARTTARAEKR